MCVYIFHVILVCFYRYIYVNFIKYFNVYLNGLLFFYVSKLILFDNDSLFSAIRILGNLIDEVTIV